MRKFISVILVLFLVQGCLNYKQTTTIQKDKSGKMFIHYWMPWEGAQDTVIMNKTALFSHDSLYAEFNRGFTEIKDIYVFRNFEDSTLHAQAEFYFTSVDSLKQLRAFRDANIMVRKGMSNTYKFSQYISPFPNGFTYGNDSLEIEYVYYLPGRIINHNADELSLNKLTWHFTPEKIGKGTVISATYIPFKLGHTPYWIYYLMLFMLVTVFVFILYKAAKAK